MKAEIVEGAVRIRLSAADQKKIQDVKAMLSIIEQQAGTVAADWAIGGRIDELVKLCVNSQA